MDCHSELMVRTELHGVCYWQSLDWAEEQRFLDEIENKPKQYRLIRIRRFNTQGKS